MTLVATGRVWRRRSFVATVFALARDGGSLTDQALPAGEAAVGADELMIRLFQQEGASLVRLARLFTDDRNAAEDLVQEAFIRLHRSAGRIRDPNKAAPYLRSIVLNLARDHNRRGLMSLRHRDAMLPEGTAPAFDDKIVEIGEHRRVIDALRDLAPRQRDCLVLRFFYDLSEREIAETLGISPNSVKTHCRRGMAGLAATLGGPES
ncbi:MAG: SigE family RNA polymerase sigma factor [Acidimicrobiia bacterium]|nr:SigE family RNA polymerase sigma factor [Acidimicrobiia bacterium]